MNGYMHADEALEYVLKNFSFQTVLDIGSGEGLHAAYFRQHGKTVIQLDPSQHWGSAADIKADFLDFSFSEPFDLVWASHVLEHQPNVNAFLRGIFKALKPGGIFAITVPPAKPNIVGGHVSIWNGGLLIYNLIIAGFDCRDLHFKKYHYNLSAIGRKTHAQFPPLRMDAGDIETLAPYFPIPAVQEFDGNLEQINWDDAVDPRPVAGNVRSVESLIIEDFMSLDPLDSDQANLLWAANCVSLSGPLAEFGVFQGTSLRLLSERFPDRLVHGLDSFKGLPEPWICSPTSTYPAGHFSLESLPGPFAANVKLFPGFFDQSLPAWRMSITGPFSLLHIDASLYSSAREILFHLNDFIASGTVIVFGNLGDWRNLGTYPLWKEGEWRALLEWMSSFNREVRLLSRGTDHSAAVIVSR